MTDLEKIAYLISSIFYHGNFKAETNNEMDLEALLKKNGYWIDSDAKAIKDFLKFEKSLELSEDIKQDSK